MSNFQIQMTGKQISIELERKTDNLKTQLARARQLAEVGGGNRRDRDVEHLSSSLANIERFAMFLDATTVYTLTTPDLAALGLFRADTYFEASSLSIF